MDRAVHAVALAFVGIALLAGCNDSPTANPGTPPPHGGELITLPEGRGLVEVVRKPAPAKGASTKAEVSFYFYSTPYTPVSPAPSTGTLTLGRKKITLTGEGGSLVTPPGPTVFAKGQPLDGTLSVELAGKTENVPLETR